MSKSAHRSDYGLPGPVGRSYRQVAPVAGRTLADAARELYVTAEELRRDLGPLLEMDIVRIAADGTLVVAPPAEALARYVRLTATNLAHSASQMSVVADAIPLLAGVGAVASGAPGRAVDAQVCEPDDVPAMLGQWVRETQGDITFLRPDQWRFPSESEMAGVMEHAVQDGRRVRAIYPVRAVAEAPEVLRARAAIGEQIRLLPQVETRLAIIGPRLLVPEQLGVSVAPQVVVREPVLVDLVVRWVDQLWDRATAVPELERRGARPDLRRMLLVQLARGAKDEQIARILGVSLRTVRRRIAALMVELGVDTRFQAGVEAARRGWL